MTSRERAEAAIQIRRDAAGKTTVCLIHSDGKRGDILWSFNHPEDATGTAEQYRSYLVAALDAHAAEAVAAERERCADIIWTVLHPLPGPAAPWHALAERIVAAIRARGLPETS